MTVYETLITTWNYRGRNLEIAYNELSSIKKMCPDLFSEETCGSILVSGHLPKAITKFLHFGLSLTGGSTVVSNLYKCACSRLGPKFAYSLYGVFLGLLRQSISMTYPDEETGSYHVTRKTKASRNNERPRD